jgi:hypothetical protein
MEKEEELFNYLNNKEYPKGSSKDDKRKHFRKITSLSSWLRLIQFNFLSFITYFFAINLSLRLSSSLTNDSLPDISHGNNTCILNGRLHETFYSKRFVYPNAFF